MSDVYYPETIRTGAGTLQHRLKFKSTRLESLIDTLDLAVGTSLAVGVTVRHGELALALDAEPEGKDGANVMTVQGDGPERSYLRVTIPEPLAVALDLDERGLRVAASTSTDQRAVIPLGGETRTFDVDPLDESPVYQTGESEAVQTYLPSAVGDAIGIDVGDRVRFEVVLGGEHPVLLIGSTDDSGSSTASIHGAGPNDSQLEVTLPKAVVHALGIGPDGIGERSIEWTHFGPAALATF